MIEDWQPDENHYVVGALLGYLFNENIIVTDALQALISLYIIYYHEHRYTMKQKSFNETLVCRLLFL